jgi:methionine sulfoxide reductase catalytic subunit
MLIRRRRGWELPESAATPEHTYLDRPRLLRALGVGGAILAAPAALRMRTPNDAPTAEAAAPARDPSAALYPVARNDRYALDRPLTDEAFATSYNNFYEFGSHKSIAQAAQALPIRPWQVVLARRGRWRCPGAALRSPRSSITRARSLPPSTSR